MPETGAAALVESAAARLRNAGWHVVAKTDQPPAFYGHTATKGQLVMNIVAALHTGPNRFISVWFEADRETDPPLLAALTFAGLLFGALPGWLLAAWVLRRRPRLSRNAKILTAIAGCYVVAMLAPGVIETFFLLGKQLFDHESNLPVFRSFVASVGRPGAILAAPFAAAILLVTAVGQRTVGSWRSSRSRA